MSNKKVEKEKALIKIIVLGCSNVGKTSLMERFATGRFSGIRRPTVGSDFMTKKIEIHDIEVSLQIWDTAGQERFHQATIGNSFYRGSHGALLVYDVNDDKSAEQISQWRDECVNKSDNNTFFPIVVIGNKIDIRDSLPPDVPRVDQSSIVDWCRENSYGHIETSAKDGFGVEAAMMAITALALESQRAAPKRQKSSNDAIILKKLYETKKDSFCDSCLK